MSSGRALDRGPLESESRTGRWPGEGVWIQEAALMRHETCLDRQEGEGWGEIAQCRKGDQEDVGVIH